MFGFLVPGPCDKQTHLRYRQIYAAFCAHHRARHGTGLSLLLSYEAIFLLTLAIESGGCAAPSAKTPRCCRLRSDPTNRWGIDRQLADYCSDFGTLLAKIKIEDDVRDHGHLSSRLAARWFRKPFRRCLADLEKVDPSIPSVAANVVKQHLELERRSSCGISMASYAEPTARGFAVLFANLARASAYLSQHEELFKKIGHAIGGAILATDCCEDRQADLKTGQFNPIKTRADFDAARRFALQNITEAGFACGDLYLSTPQPSIASSVLNRAFKRIAKLEFESQTIPRNPARKETALLDRIPISMRPTLRQGDCDCGADACCSVGCDSCFSGGCDVGCDGCSVCDFGENTGCLRCSSNGCSCNGCGVVEGCCDSCCDNTGKKKKTAGENAGLTNSTDSMAGKTGTCIGPLAPMGLIRVDGIERPAKSENGFLESGTLVRIIQEEAFGVLVRAAEPKE